MVVKEVEQCEEAQMWTLMNVIMMINHGKPRAGGEPGAVLASEKTGAELTEWKTERMETSERSSRVKHCATLPFDRRK